MSIWSRKKSEFLPLNENRIDVPKKEIPRALTFISMSTENRHLHVKGLDLKSTGITLAGESTQEKRLSYWSDHTDVVRRSRSWQEECGVGSPRVKLWGEQRKRGLAHRECRGQSIR